MTILGDAMRNQAVAFAFAGSLLWMNVPGRYCGEYDGQVRVHEDQNRPCPPGAVAWDVPEYNFYQRRIESVLSQYEAPPATAHVEASR